MFAFAYAFTYTVMLVVLIATSTTTVNAYGIHATFSTTSTTSKTSKTSSCSADAPLFAIASRFAAFDATTSTTTTHVPIVTTTRVRCDHDHDRKRDRTDDGEFRGGLVALLASHAMIPPPEYAVLDVNDGDVHTLAEHMPFREYRVLCALSGVRPVELCDTHLSVQRRGAVLCRLLQRARAALALIPIATERPPPSTNQPRNTAFCKRLNVVVHS